MQVFSDLKEIGKKSSISSLGVHSVFQHPIILSIGNFDGVHLGHQKIFKAMQDLKTQEGSLVVLTFSNHPLEIIHPGWVVSKITPIEEKLELFKNHKIDATILLQFTKQLQNTSYIDFLKQIKEHIPFDHLVLGKDAAFGKDQQGDEAALKNLQHQLHFKVHYVDRITEEGSVISSKIIRKKLEEGDLKAVNQFLGRNYTLFAPHHIASLQDTGENKLKITFDFTSHCLLPSGYYFIKIKTDEHECTAIAYMTALASDLAAKTFDLEIFIKGNKVPFMNDQIKIEFLRKTSKINLPEDLEMTGCKIIPFNSRVI
jgi:riboflavin kinase/FMN adenylyltransferase